MVTQKIRATAEKELVKRADGYVVLRVRLLAGDTLTLTGQFNEIELGREYEWLGRYVFHPSYGRQFQAESALLVPATSLLGIEKFLASGRFKGIGAKTAAKIVAHFGALTMETLFEQPERIEEVPGLSSKLREKIRMNFRQEKDFARLGSFLRSHDLPMHLAEKLIAVYGSGTTALQLLQTTPYQIIEDVYGIGFKTADHIAQAIGMRADSDERIAAGLMVVLQEASEDGHLFLPMGEWITRACERLTQDQERVMRVGTLLSGRGAVILEDLGLSDLAVYLPYSHKIEVGIALKLHTLFMGNGNEDAEQVQGYDEQDELLLAGLSDQQQKAAKALLTERFVVLTGGPGTGKTTTVKAVIGLCQKRSYRVILAAPTGRAAKRMTQSADFPATTLHRLLEVGKSSRGGFGFTKDHTNPLEGDVIILDEVSMIDAALFYHFLDALKVGVRLLLVGDPEQLPSVGPGTVLADIIASGLAKVHALDLVFRQGAHSAIVLAAHDVRQGIMPDLTHDRHADFFMIAQEDPQKTAELIEDLVVRRLPVYLSQSALDAIQVISPMRKGYCGIDACNERLSRRLADQDGPTLTHGQRTFHLHDKVMHTKNDYERDLYNGDMGTVVAIYEDSLAVRFFKEDDTLCEEVFSKTELSAIVHAFAISVHKSQGSEYPCVVLPMVREHAVMLQRHLLYTAMTRAKQLLVIVGSTKALSLAVSREAVAKRFSGLYLRIKQDGLP
nr:ATP-dependent RecD-like DNA helicase [Bacilli bacterium]